MVKFIILHERELAQEIMGVNIYRPRSHCPASIQPKPASIPPWRPPGDAAGLYREGDHPNHPVLFKQGAVIMDRSVSHAKAQTGGFAFYARSLCMISSYSQFLGRRRNVHSSILEHSRCGVSTLGTVNDGLGS